MSERWGGNVKQKCRKKKSTTRIAGSKKRRGSIEEQLKKGELEKANATGEEPCNLRGVGNHATSN